MVILGVSDGLDAGAALVVGDQVVAVAPQAHLDRIRRSRAFPWDAIDTVLAATGTAPGDVQRIAVAGRFSPPFFVRRHPGVHAFTRDPFSPLHGANVFWQRVLRSSGFGAVEADRASDWLGQRFAARGFRPLRMVLVDVHRALAAAAYRCQPRDQALVVTLHPRGDGLCLAVHRGRAGQLDKLHGQQDLGALHVHLPRCMASLGLDPWVDGPRLWALAGRGEPDPALVAALLPELEVAGYRLISRSTTADGVHEPPWGLLRRARVSTAAASVLAHLQNVIPSVLAALVQRFGATTSGVVAVGGSLFANPRLLADLAAVPGVEELHTAPLPGHSALALGAALAEAGLAPCVRHARRIGVRPATAGGPVDLDHVAARLADRWPVVRFLAGACGAEHGLGAASVLVRADDPDLVELIRRRLGLPDEAEPAVLALRDVVRVRRASALAGPLLAGLAAAQIEDAPTPLPRCVTADGRIQLVPVEATGDADLVDLMQRVRAQAGVAALAAWPLAVDAEPPIADAEGALKVARRAGAAGAWIGSGWVGLV